MISAAIYARVSSDRQEREETVQSQLSELQARVREDGLVNWHELIDEGYGRDNLVRPGLDSLRDLVAQGGLDRVYVQAPDRLASGAKLVILVEEFQKHGVEVVFLKGSVEDTPEGKLLLHMQGAIAEYERTKIAERTRRGKLYWARQGAMVGGHAPYGYRFVRRTDSERARLEVDESKAAVVRAMFRWMVEDQMSTRAMARRLTERGTPTARGAAQWQPMAVDRMLRNTVYRGIFFYQRAESAEPSRRLTSDPYKQRRKTGRKARPQGDWISIPVPAIVDEATWEAVQAQLQRNAQHASRNNTRHQYLLRGLVRCPRCGGAYCGFTRGGSSGYRCLRAHSGNSSTGARCTPGAVPAEPVEDAVWTAIAEALRNPDLLLQEYERRMEQAATPEGLDADRKRTAVALRRTHAHEDRITEAYVAEAMDLERYKGEMEKLRQQRTELERDAGEIDRREKQQHESRSAVDDLGRFCRQISQGLDAMTFEERQQLLRLVVERVIVEDGHVQVDAIIPAPQDGELCNRRGELVEPRNLARPSILPRKDLGRTGIGPFLVWRGPLLVVRRSDEASQRGAGSPGLEWVQGTPCLPQTGHSSMRHAISQKKCS